MDEILRVIIKGFPEQTLDRCLNKTLNKPLKGIIIPEIVHNITILVQSLHKVTDFKINNWAFKAINNKKDRCSKQG